MRRPRCDVFFITLKSPERLFSPPPATNDYAIIAPRVVHPGRARVFTHAKLSTGQR